MVEMLTRTCLNHACAPNRDRAWGVSRADWFDQCCAEVQKCFPHLNQSNLSTNITAPIYRPVLSSQTDKLNLRFPVLFEKSPFSPNETN